VSANQRLKLQTNLGKALMFSQGFGAEGRLHTRPGTCRGIDDPTERFTSYFGLYVGNLMRGELGFARGIVETFVGETRSTYDGVWGWSPPSGIDVPLPG